VRIEKFGKSILGKITKTDTIRCRISKLKCTKFDFGRAFGGSYSAPPDSLAGFKGSGSEGREGRKDWREGQGREKKGAEVTYF